MPYLNESLKKFNADLSAKLPAPGGGSAAALVGALASSLNCMVANYTVGNEKYAAVDKEVRELLKISENLRDELEMLIEEDINAYVNYSKAAKLPKNTEVEKKLRLEEIEIASKKAAEVPLKIMISCAKVLEACEPLLLKGNRNLVTDVGVAAYFANAALKSANLNVLVNILYLKDEVFKSKISGITKDLLLKSREIERQVEAKCQESLKG